MKEVKETTTLTPPEGKKKPDEFLTISLSTDAQAGLALLLINSLRLHEGNRTRGVYDDNPNFIKQIAEVRKIYDTITNKIWGEPRRRHNR